MPERKIEDEDVEQEGFGYTIVGEWREIVDFGEKIVSAFENNEVESETITEWDSWRPRMGEKETEMKNKTVEKAKVDQGENTQEMADEVAEHLTETKKKTAQGDIEKAAENAKGSAKSAGKAVDGASRDIMRKIEDKVYKSITKTNPLYFDSQDFNASLEVLSSIPAKIKSMFNADSEREYKLTIKPESEDVEDALDEKFNGNGEK